MFSNMTQQPPPVQLTYLGKSTPAPTTPDEVVLDRVPNAHPDTPYLVRFSAPEFTTLCAVTGQPDFAHFVIDYVPRAWLIESKALKFYLGSFRNHSAFHEQCTVTIGKRLASTYEPEFLRISGYWYPRGGMPIDVFWQLGALPAGVWLPDPGIPAYRGRG
jgi:7-cyano-7-deazaguanine reductase